MDRAALSAVGSKPVPNSFEPNDGMVTDVMVTRKSCGVKPSLGCSRSPPPALLKGCSNGEGAGGSATWPEL